MTRDEIQALVESEYHRRYPDWPPVYATDVVEDLFGGELVVVRTKPPQNIEEMCFIDRHTGIRIFSNTEELARFIENKTKAPLLDEARRKINIWVAIAGLASVTLLVFALWNRVDGPMVTKNLAAIGGLPFSFIAAFAIVALFRQGETPLDFEGFGVKMKGAAGEIILWLLCFLAISGAIALLWRT
jgi:hypothetical protein